MFNLISLENGLENIEGFYFGGIHAGFKDNEQNDLGFIRSNKPVDVFAVFTNNKFKAAPIRHFLQYKKNFKTNFLLLNSKNANAMTGNNGIEDINEIFETLSKKVNLINPIMSSTGIIGYRLNKKKIIDSALKFDLNSRNSDDVAKSIMTTDRFKKEIAFKVELQNGSTFNIAAICKGAGMINPSLATMLCFILTDADIPKRDMKELLQDSIKDSFNAISVDGDTSTNDTIMLFSSKKRKVYDKEAFRFALKKLTLNLALKVVEDGEGSSKVVAFEVNGALNDKEAMKSAKALSNSLLVKTAIFGNDPNWGRIASTIGSSGIACDESKLSIYYDNVLVYGQNYQQSILLTEQEAHKIMIKDNYKITCNLGIGTGKFTAYGCDLGHEYVKINADYRS